jgi:hypothetical protein
MAVIAVMVPAHAGKRYAAGRPSRGPWSHSGAAQHTLHAEKHD